MAFAKKLDSSLILLRRALHGKVGERDMAHGKFQ